MTPQKQLFFHRPPDTYGDCHRTCIACLLDLPAEQVPNWAESHWDDSVAFNQAVDDWLMENFKLRQFHIVYPGDTGLDSVLAAIESMNPGCLFLLCGESRNRVAHSVIAGQGRILWDPSRDNSGICEPILGYWWVTLLVPNNHYAPYVDEQAEISKKAWASLDRSVPGRDHESEDPGHTGQ